MTRAHMPRSTVGKQVIEPEWQGVEEEEEKAPASKSDLLAPMIAKATPGPPGPAVHISGGCVQSEATLTTLAILKACMPQMK